MLSSYLSGRLNELLKFGLGTLWMQVDTDNQSHFAHAIGISIGDLDDILTFSDLLEPTLLGENGVPC